MEIERAIADCRQHEQVDVGIPIRRFREVKTVLDRNGIYYKKIGRGIALIREEFNGLCKRKRYMVGARIGYVESEDFDDTDHISMVYLKLTTKKELLKS